MTRWLRAYFVGEVPEREQIVTAIHQLQTLPEHDRMRHGPMRKSEPESPREQPQSLQEWTQRYDQRRTA